MATEIAASDLSLPPAHVIVFRGRESIIEQLKIQPESEGPEICLDFEQVEAVGSEELSALVGFTIRMRHAGKTVKTCNMGPIVRQVFEITRFFKLASSTD